jgi:acetyl esterase
MSAHLRSLFVVTCIGSALVGGCNRPHERSQDRNHGQEPSLGAQGKSSTATPASPTVTNAPDAIPANDTKKDPLSKLDKDMKRVIDQLDALGAKRIETLTATEARQQPTAAEAVTAVLQRDGKPITPEPVAKVEDKTIKTPAGSLKARVYTPVGGKAPYPLIVYFHGGGFVVGTLDSYDATPRSLANGTEAVVLSADYRHAPENKFPAAQEDAHAVYAWALKNAASIGADPRNVAVAGESVGGNLALNVAIMARDKAEALPTHLLLVYPVASADMNSESYREYADAKPLDKAAMSWFMDKYLKNPAEVNDPRINLVGAKLNGLPPTTIINAEIDPLRSDGDLLKQKLKDADVTVEQKTYNGVTHEFFGMGAVVEDAKDAMKFACSELKDAFDKHARQSSGL